ncbi:MAG: aldose 1-epimerase [Planctomycetes bacterium]|nr:aldose 1-epimerase [Planctomycetota bacterium]
MPFACQWEQRPNTTAESDRVAVLTDGKNRLEVAPTLGFNAYRWQAGGLDLLFRGPRFFDEKRSTRGGFPILFPFPNRIRDGKFAFPSGDANPTTFALPVNDPANKNAIHGFAHSRPWRVVDQGARAGVAWITGEYHASVDAPDTLPLWPTDHRLRVTYRLLDHVLRIEADADNPSGKPLPFGLGYHPYFAIAPFGGPQAYITVAAAKRWELVDSLPTGKIIDLGEARDLRHGQYYAGLQLDDVMTNLYTFAYDPQEQLGLTGVIQHPAGTGMLTLWTSEDFRELVLFTPPHRQAICIEPYTCTTDAVNLSAKAIDTGWKILKPGEHWQGVVEVHLAN